MKIDIQKQVDVFKDFFDANYRVDIHKIIQEGIHSLIVNFTDLAEYDIELSEQLIEEPEETMKSAEIALEQFDILKKKKIRVRFYNLPLTQEVHIRNLRSIHIDKFIFSTGIVRQASDVRPQVTNARFECPACGNVISILQIEQAFREPSRCSCGRRGRFKLLSKDLVDAQRLVVEEAPEMLEGGEQPKRISIFLKADLVEPKMEKRTTPGSKIKIFGVVKELPIPLKTGTQSTRYDLMIDANYIEPLEETYEEIVINEEDEKRIIELSKDPRVYEKLIATVAPSIYGHEDVKSALVLQLMGGVRKERKDGTKTRGDTHMLLVGDPGCISGDSQIALIYKGMERIQNLGEKHLQPIKEYVTKIRKNARDKQYSLATLFHHYPNQPVLKVVTETGKEIVCTYNQPFLTRGGWERADKLMLGSEIRVMPKLPNCIKRLVDTNFKKVEKKTKSLKKVFIPNKFTKELAALCGYVIGDGNVHKNGYRITCYVNNEEKDLIQQLSKLWKRTFNITPTIYLKKGGGSKSIYDGKKLRKFISKQDIYTLEINSRQIAESLSFLSKKRVPQQIFKSPKSVAASFISWLFEADGCAFGKGRGKTSVQLKSITHDLLRDVQLLLLYFGIQSRIIGDNLCIRRSRDMKLFAKYIGFNSKKKNLALKEVLKDIKKKSYTQKRKNPQRYEKIKEIIPAGTKDVYDFEVPIDHSFIANGIVCHNSGKSELLKFIATAAPKARYISGKGASSAGLTASVVKDEFLKGWALEAGAVVLANGGVACLDELDKMGEGDASALHEAMEQQSVTISKANIQASLRARTTILAAANPKLGRFDPYQLIATQIAMPPTLINRFDLIFIIKDLPTREKDDKIASHILNIQKSSDELKYEVPLDLFKKYIAYAKQRINPKLTDSALKEIKEFYVNLRNMETVGEAGIKPIPITARQLEALVRLAEASARVRLSKQVTKLDSKRAINILKHCLMAVGFDYETQTFDIDRISTGITASQRSKIVIIREIIDLLVAKGIKSIPLEEIISEALGKGLTEDQVEEAIDKLKREGIIFEPRRNFISKV